MSGIAGRVGFGADWSNASSGFQCHGNGQEAEIAVMVEILVANCLGTL
jgi:hypothetical protein